MQPAQAGSYILVVTNSFGSATSAVAVLSMMNPDADGDGMLDEWELANGLDSSNQRESRL